MNLVTYLLKYICPATQKKKARKGANQATPGNNPQIAWSIMDHFYCNLFPLYSACRDGSNDGIHVNHRYRWTSKTISGQKKHDVSATSRIPLLFLCCAFLDSLLHLTNIHGYVTVLSQGFPFSSSEGAHISSRKR